MERYVSRTPTHICGTPWLLLCEGWAFLASSGTRSNKSKKPPLAILPFQGEANSNFERDLYNCTFPTLIGEQIVFWRSNLLLQTPGGSSFNSQKHLLGLCKQQNLKIDRGCLKVQNLWLQGATIDGSCYRLNSTFTFKRLKSFKSRMIFFQVCSAQHRQLPTHQSQLSNSEVDTIESTIWSNPKSPLGTIKQLIMELFQIQECLKLLWPSLSTLMMKKMASILGSSRLPP